MPTWSKDFEALSEEERAEIKAYLHDTTKTPLSDLELRAVYWLRECGFVEGADFNWQYRIGQYVVDLLHPGDRIIELYGCGYHQHGCLGRPWWPDVIAADERRQKRLEAAGFQFDVIWNCEDVEFRLMDLMQ